MENQSLIDEIVKWNELLSKENTMLYELAFFKIYIKFEKFIYEIFVHYATNQKSSKGYKPNIKLKFDDERHLKQTLTDKKFIDFFSNFERCDVLCESILDKNPISTFLKSVDKTNFEEMKCIRNYIAHESLESRNTYIRKVLYNGNFIEPNVYLTKKNKNTAEMNYTKYINLIRHISEFIIQPEAL